MEDLLRVSSLAVSYNGKRVLSDLTFSLKPGEVLGIVGESGSGKSTILRAILGILGSGGAVNGGEIFFSGSSLLEMDEKQMREMRGAQIGMIFQDAGASLCPVRRVGSQMWEAMAAHEEITKAQAREQALELLENLGFSEAERIWDSYPFELSGGQKRRVAIAGVLAMEPDILVLDEPTAGLDPKGRDEILGQISHLQKETGISVVLVSHSMEDVANYVERIIVMNKGKVMFDDVPHRVFSHVKELEAVGLAAPQVTYILHQLKDNGFDVDPSATTIEEAKETILQAVRKNSK